MRVAARGSNSYTRKSCRYGSDPGHTAYRDRGHDAFPWGAL